MTLYADIARHAAAWRRCAHTVLFLAASVLSLAARGDPVAIDQVVAVVNDGVIFSSQLDERFAAVTRQISTSLDEPSRAALRQQVLERLIIESIQLQLGERAGVTISNEELQDTIAGIARQNNTDLAGLRSRIEADGLTYRAFTKNVEQQMIIERVQQAAVSKRIEVTDQDIANFLGSEEGKQRISVTYHLAHILIPFDPADEASRSSAQSLAGQIVRQTRQVTASRDDFATLARQYSKAQDADSGGDLGWRRKDELPSLYAGKVDALAVGAVSDPFEAGNSLHILKLVEKKGLDDKWIHQTHVRHILVKTSIVRSEDEARQLLTDLRQQLEDHADFAALAKKYSEDYGSALKGGDLGWISPGQLVPEFQSVMDATPEQGISQPFKTQYGWHLLQVLERRDQNMSSDMLKQATRNFLLQRKFEEELPRWLKEMRDEAYVDIKLPAAPATAN